jgi:fucose 4-O-acetylase-like acetyltransferase
MFADRSPDPSARSSRRRYGSYASTSREPIAVMTVSTDTRQPQADRELPAVPPAKQRDPYFDNVKFLAVVLVVLGHAWYPLAGNRMVDAAHLFVYSFHMPVFILIAGYFSRRFATTRGKVRRLVVGVGVPYLVFEAAYPLYASLLDGKRFVWSPLSPYAIMWFLLALMMWRLSTPLWQQLRWPLPVAVAISLAAGTIQLPDQVVIRTLEFLPFFVGGLLLREEHFRLLRSRPVRAAAVLVTAAAAVTAILAEPHLNPEWFNYRLSDKDFGVAPIVAVAMRFAVLLCGMAMTAAFLALVPRRRMWFTDLGTGSMYVYLLHGFVVFGATYAGWYDWADELGRIGGPAVVTALGVAVTLVLASGPVRSAFRWVVEPRLEWAFRR